MKKKTTIDDVLSEMGFTEVEKETFISCIKIVKEGQKNETIDPQSEIESLIEGVVENEI